MSLKLKKEINKKNSRYNPVIGGHCGQSTLVSAKIYLCFLSFIVCEFNLLKQTSSSLRLSFEVNGISAFCFCGWEKDGPAFSANESCMFKYEILYLLDLVRNITD